MIFISIVIYIFREGTAVYIDREETEMVHVPGIFAECIVYHNRLFC